PRDRSGTLGAHPVHRSLCSVCCMSTTPPVSSERVSLLTSRSGVKLCRREIARTMRATGVDTATQILDVAERLVQERGFNGFSYADVARELGISKAALHYHYPGKAELGEALIERYAARFTDALVAVDAREIDAAEKL